jgi:beta-1,4-mannosyltransferase
MNSFDNLKTLATDRSTARSSLGIGENSFAISTFGNFRTQSEVSLVHKAINYLDLQNSKIVFAGRLPWYNRRWQRVYTRMLHRQWAARHKVIELSGYTDDSQTVALFQAADVMIVPRFGRHLNSGILALAMTFGTPVVAPDYSVFRELLEGSDNEFYEPRNSKAMADAIMRISQKGAEKIRNSNLNRFSTWGWDRILDRLIARLNAD